MNQRNVKYLRIVADLPKSAAQPLAGQLAFSFARDNHVIFLANVSNASEDVFLATLEKTEPDLIVDLRLVPRFDFGRLSRRTAFRMFETMSARYYDMPCRLGVASLNDASLNPAFLVDPLAEILKEVPHARRVLMLLDDSRDLEVSLKVFSERIYPRPREGWQVMRIND